MPADEHQFGEESNAARQRDPPREVAVRQPVDRRGVLVEHALQRRPPPALQACGHKHQNAQRLPETNLGPTEERRQQPVPQLVNDQSAEGDKRHER